MGDLLNPAPEEQEHKVPAPQQRPPLYPLKTQWSSAQRLCKQKLPKDAPIFRKGPTRGEVLFPPYEAGNDAILAKEHERYQVFPRGEIGQHCHHIPYSSDKKTFLSKTGRDAFEGISSYWHLVNRKADCCDSVPVHFQDTWRGTRICRHVGLQYRLGPHHAILQVLQIFEGKLGCRMKHRRRLTYVFRRLRRKCSMLILDCERSVTVLRVVLLQRKASSHCCCGQT